MTQSIYSDYQSLLFPIAYNLLGNASDAEDLVQETMLKWLSVKRKDIENVKGYLVRTLINKCLNFIRDRKRESRKEVEVAPELLRDYLPAWIENSNHLSLGMLALLEKLNPMERAVFLLKEIFDYSHKEIAELLGISEENARQILARARRHLRSDAQRFEANPDHHLHLYRTFVEVIQGDNMDKLIKILREDIDIDVRPAASYQMGNQAIGDFLWQNKLSGLEFRLRWLRGLPAIVAYLLDRPMWVIRLTFREDQISHIRINEVLEQPVPIGLS